MKDAQKSELNFDKDTLVWLGDPCYAPEMNHSFDDNKTWGEFCDLYLGMDGEDPDCPSHVVEHKGVEFVVGGTAHGDGCYHVSPVGGECDVDAGLLSVIPAGAFGLDANSGENYGGVFTTVKGRCYVDDEGTLHAGRITIVTGYTCDNCGAVEDECCCERCCSCGEWLDRMGDCECEEVCICCGYHEDECECEDDED